jgi:hypothetical protein
MHVTITSLMDRPLAWVPVQPPCPRPEPIRPDELKPHPAELQLRSDAGDSLQRWLDLCG